MGVTIGVVCSIGVGDARGGRSRNEDNYLICRDGKATWRHADADRSEPAAGSGVLLAVCDGMGGAEDGDIASTTAVRVMAKLYRPGAPKDPARALRKYVVESHRRLYDRAREAGPVAMGTTLTACWLFDTHAAWVQVGDSRLYLWRDGKLAQISADHTRAEFAWRDGRSAVSEGHALAQNFIYGSRGLGDDASIRVEATRDADSFEVRAGDRLLMCSDGLHGAVDDASIADVLHHVGDPQAAAVACVERAIARGSCDNITVLIANID